MAKTFPSSHFTGYDFSKEAIQNASNKSQKLGLSNTTFEQQNSLVKRSNLFPQFLHSTYMIKISLQKWSLIQKWSTKTAFCRNVKITFCVPLSWEIKVTASSNFRLRTFIIFILMKNRTFNTVLVLNNMDHSSKIAGQRKIPLCQDCQSGSYHQHCELVE